jgi:hypothetical protein
MAFFAEQELPVDNEIGSLEIIYSGFTSIRSHTIIPSGATLVIESGARVIIL